MCSEAQWREIGKFDKVRGPSRSTSTSSRRPRWSSLLGPVGSAGRVWRVQACPKATYELPGQPLSSLDLMSSQCLVDLAPDAINFIFPSFSSRPTVAPVPVRQFLSSLVRGLFPDFSRLYLFLYPVQTASCLISAICTHSAQQSYLSLSPPPSLVRAPRTRFISISTRSSISVNNVTTSDASCGCPNVDHHTTHCAELVWLSAPSVARVCQSSSGY